MSEIITVYSYYFAAGTGALKGVKDYHSGVVISFSGPFDKFKDRILYKGPLKLLLEKENIETSPFLKMRTEQILSKLSLN